MTTRVYAFNTECIRDGIPLNGEWVIATDNSYKFAEAYVRNQLLLGGMESIKIRCISAKSAIMIPKVPDK